MVMKNKLLEDIEKLQQKLNRSINKTGEVDHQVITISQKLDVLLNKYENISVN